MYTQSYWYYFLDESINILEFVEKTQNFPSLDTALFLFNFSNKILAGVFRPCGAPASCIDAHAWGGRFDAQICLMLI